MALLKCPPSAPCFDQVVPYMKLYTTFVNNFDEALRVLAQADSPGRCNHSDTTLYISLAILHTKHTGRRQNDFNVYA